MNYRKLKWLVALPLVVFGLPAAAQNNTTGKYIAWSADTAILILLRIEKDSTGYRCHYDLPAKLIIDAAARSVRLKGDTLNIYLQQPIVTVSAIITPENHFKNVVWKQNGQATELKMLPLLRPQTPRPPYPYLSDSVEYDNADKTVHLGATLTRPKGAVKRVPAMILITGSGQQERDETIFEHRSGAVLADYFTKKGMAVLRVDDRLRGKSRGDVLKATTADFAEDVLTSLAWLKKQPGIDTSNIGLAGHSEGGIISAMAYKAWPHFSFIISQGGAGVPGSAILLHQQTDPVKKFVTPVAYDAFYRLTGDAFASLEKNYNNDSLAAKGLAEAFDNWKKQQPDSILIPLNAKNLTGANYSNALKMEYANPWMKYFIHEDPAPSWQTVKCPVLVLNGANDTQVLAAQNTTAIRTALQKGGNRKVTVRIFPELNHLFQHSRTGELTEYAMIEETFSPEVLTVMSNWLQSIGVIK